MSELVFTITARDQASRVFNDVRRNSQRMGDGVKRSSTALSVAGSVARGAAKAFKMLALATAGATAAAGVVAAKVGKEVVNSASDMNETMSKSQQIFGANASAMLKWSENAAHSFGLSQEAALSGAAQFGNFFDQIGLGGKTAVLMSKRLVKLSADLGSFNNADPAEVMLAFQAATRGEYDTLQKFIPTVNAASIEIAALESSGKKSRKELTVADKAMGLFAIANRDAGKAVGDFARTSEGLANQQRILRASIEDTKAKIGQALLPGITVIGAAINKYAIPALRELWAEHGPRIQEVFTRMAARIGYFIKQMSSGDLSPMQRDLGQLGSNIAKLGPVLGELWTEMRKMKAELPSLADLVRVFNVGIGFLADNVDTLKAALPYLIGLYAAWKLGQLAANVATVAAIPLRIMETLATHRLTQAMAGHTAALNANTIAQGGSTAATNVGVLARIREAIQLKVNAFWLKVEQINRRGGIQVIIAEKIAILQIRLARMKEAAQTKINAFWLRVEQINRQGGIFAIAKHRAAIIASTVAQKASLVWTKLVTAAQWAWNVALNANPIGAIILIIVALIAVLVACWFKFEGFRKVVTKAWEGIAKAAIWAWQNVLQPTLKAIATGVMWLWNNAMKPYLGFILAIWRFVFTAIKGFFTNVWVPTIRAIGTGVMWLWNSMIKPYVGFILAAWRLAFTAIRGFVTGIWLPAMRAIGSAAMWVWNSAIKPAVNFIMAAWRFAFAAIRGYWQTVLQPVIRAIGAAASWLWNNAIKPAINRIREAWSTVLSAMRAVWNNVLKPTFDAFGNAVNTVKNKFDTAITGIGKIWDRLKSLMSKPVKAVIDTVFNGGLIKGWNWIADKVLDGKYRIPKIEFKGFATGGVMPGYTPGRDNALIAVGGGEAIMRPEWTRAIGEDKINAWNAAARRGGVPAVARELRLQGFADGGIFGAVKSLGSKVWNTAKDTVKGVTDFLSNPTSFLRNMMKGPLSQMQRFRDSTIGKMITDVPPRLIDHVINKAKEFAFGPNPKAIDGGMGVRGTGSIAAMQDFAMRQRGKRYVFGAVGPNSYDCSGLAGNFYAMATGRRLYRRYFLANNPSMGRTPGLRRGPGKALTFLIGGQPGTGHMTTRINGMNVEAYGGNGVPLAIGRIGTPTSYFHTAWHVPGFARGGIPRKPNGLLEGVLSWMRAGWPEPYLYDKGGVLPPGPTLAINNTRRNEYVTPAGAGRGGATEYLAPIVLNLDSKVVYKGLLKLRQRSGGVWELA